MRGSTLSFFSGRSTTYLNLKTGYVRSSKRGE
jgi:hypothetical protein